ncbi:hypothetical protein K9M41_04495 [Candidatus Gracilibacteria bacterium]|nr:hypothetical protein [Candidatus Gracilibacteria bacterium]
MKNLSHFNYGSDWGRFVWQYGAEQARNSSDTPEAKKELVAKGLNDLGIDFDNLNPGESVISLIEGVEFEVRKPSGDYEEVTIFSGIHEKLRGYAAITITIEGTNPPAFKVRRDREDVSFDTADEVRNEILRKTNPEELGRRQASKEQEYQERSQSIANKNREEAVDRKEEEPILEQLMRELDEVEDGNSWEQQEVRDKYANELGNKLEVAIGKYKELKRNYYVRDWPEWIKRICQKENQDIGEVNIEANITNLVQVSRKSITRLKNPDNKGVKFLINNVEENVGAMELIFTRIEEHNWKPERWEDAKQIEQWGADDIPLRQNNTRLDMFSSATGEENYLNLVSQRERIGNDYVYKKELSSLLDGMEDGTVLQSSLVDNKRLGVMRTKMNPNTGKREKVPEYYAPLVDIVVSRKPKQIFQEQIPSLLEVEYKDSSIDGRINKAYVTFFNGEVYEYDSEQDDLSKSDHFQLNGLKIERK